MRSACGRNVLYIEGSIARRFDRLRGRPLALWGQNRDLSISVTASWAIHGVLIQLRLVNASKYLFVFNAPVFLIWLCFAKADKDAPHGNHRIIFGQCYSGLTQKSIYPYCLWWLFYIFKYQTRHVLIVWPYGSTNQFAQLDGLKKHQRWDNKCDRENAYGLFSTENFNLLFLMNACHENIELPLIFARTIWVLIVFNCLHSDGGFCNDIAYLHCAIQCFSKIIVNE
jgi:hypothetical protein